MFDNIKKLREKTGVSIIDCKKALLESDNDIDKAIIYLRKTGSSILESKANRTTKNGVIGICLTDDRKNGVILEINCETDFVARSNEFETLVKQIALFYLSEYNMEKCFNFNSQVDVKEKYLVDLISDFAVKFKENIVIKRLLKVYSIDGFLFSYIHFDKKIASIIELDSNDETLALDLLMQIVSMKPKFLDIKHVPENVITSERNLFFEKLKLQHQDKNDILLNKMVDGQIAKFFKENVLLEQIFIKDTKKTIKVFLNNKVNILSYNYFSLGEC